MFHVKREMLWKVLSYPIVLVVYIVYSVWEITRYHFTGKGPWE